MHYTIGVEQTFVRIFFFFFFFFFGGGALQNFVVLSAAIVATYVHDIVVCIKINALLNLNRK